FFGAEDAEAALALLQRVESWALERGRTHVRGPLNPSLNESAGLLVEGFDTGPMLMMPHNPPEYGAYIEAAGYRKIKDLYAWLYELSSPVVPVIEKLAAPVRAKHQVDARQMTLADFDRHADEIREAYSSA